MAGCTNQCAAYQPVTDVMTLADGIKSQQQLYHPLLMLPQQRTFGIEPGSQLLITILSCLIFHHIHLFFLNTKRIHSSKMATRATFMTTKYNTAAITTLARSRHTRLVMLIVAR